MARSEDPVKERLRNEELAEEEIVGNCLGLI
jgi:hypothetical protein